MKTNIYQLILLFGPKRFLTNHIYDPNKGEIEKKAIQIQTSSAKIQNNKSNMRKHLQQKHNKRKQIQKATSKAI